MKKLRRSRANTRLSALLYNVGVLLPLNNVRAIIYYNKLRYADDVVILASTEDNLLALVNIIWHSSIIIIIIYTPRNHFCQLFRMFCFPLAYPPQPVTWRDWTPPRLRHLCSGARWT